MKPLAAAIRAHIDRSLSAEEAKEYLEAPVSDEERRNVLDLITWFRRRYPTPLERLRYVDRAYRRWTRSEPSLRSDER